MTISGNPFQNQLKMLHHLDRLIEWKQSGDTRPILMEINLTNICNQACRWCISMYSHVSNPAMSVDEKKIKRSHLEKSGCKSSGLDFPRLKGFIVEAQNFGLKAVTWSGGGEPTVYPNFSQIVAFTSNYLEQGLMTNGQFAPKHTSLIGEQMKWVRVSLDTFNPKKYAYQRFSKRFDQVIENVKELGKYSTSLGLNMNIAEWNMDEIVSFAEKGRDLGVDYVQFRPILALPFQLKENSPYVNQLGQNLLPKIKESLYIAEELSTESFKVHVSWDKFRDIEDIENNFGRTYTKCSGHNFMCVLDANGDLDVCMYHLGEDDFKMGNIYEKSLAEIWRSKKRREVKNNLCGNLDFSSCQSCCKLHNLNKFLHLTTEQPSEVNFI